MGDNATLPDGDTGLVQLGHAEVERHVLTGPGQPLDCLLVGRELRVTASAWVMNQLPADGWRVICTRHTRQLQRYTEVLAAPLPGHQGSWALIDLTGRDGSWTLGANPGPLRVYPGQAARRHGLALIWTEPELRRSAGIPVQLTINLRNSRSDVWHNQRDDSAHVAGWLLGPDGQRLPASPWVSYGHGASIPALQPGQAISLPVTLRTPDTGTLPAGRYGLEAVLVQLNLSSSPGTLLLR